MVGFLKNLGGLLYTSVFPVIRGRSFRVVVVAENDLHAIMAHSPTDGGDHLAGVSPIGVSAVFVPPAEMDIVLRTEITAKPGLAPGLFLFQLTEQGGAALDPEAMVINVAVIGRKQGPGGLLGLVHDVDYTR